MRETLRALIREHLLSEANVVGLANRQLERVGIVRLSMGSTKLQLVAVSTKELQQGRTIYRQDVAIPRILGLVTLTRGSLGVQRLTQMYADSPAVAVVLLACALETARKIVPDYSVSPAAQQIIKRYFEQNKEDAALVEPSADVDRYKGNDEPEFLRAAYLGPVGFDLDRALVQGDGAVQHALSKQSADVEEVEDAILDAALTGFRQAYNDDAKAKRPVAVDSAV